MKLEWSGVLEHLEWGERLKDPMSSLPFDHKVPQPSELLDGKRITRDNAVLAGFLMFPPRIIMPPARVEALKPPSMPS